MPSFVLTLPMERIKKVKKVYAKMKHTGKDKKNSDVGKSEISPYKNKNNRQKKSPTISIEMYR